MQTISDFVARQLREWPQAEAAHAALKDVQTRTVEVDGCPITLQFNPTRAVSSRADISPKAIAARPCFLCRANRPKEQQVLDGYDGYEILVNPFPIFPEHLTISAKEHKPQRVGLRFMEQFAADHPDRVVFYNGAHSGASAPDHQHFQAVPRQYLPLLDRIDTKQTVPMTVNTADSIDDLPPFTDEMSNIMARVVDGKVSFYLFPRKAHRPDCYNAPEPERLLVSPGAIDMAGVLILTRLTDFQTITPEQIRTIYRQVSQQ